jgi:hypothetical protein
MKLKTMTVALLAGLAAFTAACESDGDFEEAGEDIDEALDLDE